MSTILRISFLLTFAMAAKFCYGQRHLEGIVFDKDTKQRVGKVLVVNTTTGENAYNNFHGEFSIEVHKGDILIAQKEHYHTDTVVVDAQPVLLFNLKKKYIYIEQVDVFAKRNPDDILAQRKVDYDKAYRLADPGDYFSVGQNGAGLSIDAIYNLFSKEGKNARRLTRYFEKEYEENMIDLKFSKEIVSKETGLEGTLLDNFMTRYRPTYAFVMGANTYQIMYYIRSKYELFRLNPHYKTLPNLEEIDLK